MNFCRRHLSSHHDHREQPGANMHGCRRQILWLVSSNLVWWCDYAVASCSKNCHLKTTQKAAHTAHTAFEPTLLSLQDVAWIVIWHLTSRWWNLWPLEVHHQLDLRPCEKMKSTESHLHKLVNHLTLGLGFSDSSYIYSWRIHCAQAYVMLPQTAKHFLVWSIDLSWSIMFKLQAQELLSQISWSLQRRSESLHDSIAVLSSITKRDIDGWTD